MVAPVKKSVLVRRSSAVRSTVAASPNSTCPAYDNVGPAVVLFIAYLHWHGDKRDAKDQVHGCEQAIDGAKALG